MIVYSALFGGYDRVPAAPFSQSCRHVLFTDAEVDASGWEVVTVAPVGPPRLQNRSYKLQPHVHFPGESTLYHDANMLLLAEPAVIHATLLGGSSIGMVRHSRRHTLAHEFAAVKRYGLADPVMLKTQTNRYRHLLGVKIGEAGLLATTPDAEPFMTAWWAEVSTYSHRDQLALPWAANVSGIAPHLHRSRDGLVAKTEHLKARTA